MVNIEFRAVLYGKPNGLAIGVMNLENHVYSLANIVSRGSVDRVRY
jgi:hypothetical protein